jgi:hypothetical protein
MRRSQAILRMPVNTVLATLILHDGERSDVLLYIPPGEDITSLLSPGQPFLPMIKHARFCLVARSAIAVLGVVIGAEPADDSGLPVTRQRARVRLRSGTALEGELRWPASDVTTRTSDYTTEPRTIHYVVKSHMATLEEI